MTLNDLEEMVQTYLDKCEYTKPLVNSDRFVDNSYAKWACKELLREIKKAKTLPFDLDLLEFLTNFSDKLKRYAAMNQNGSLGFTLAAETVEYLIEECIFKKWQWKRKR